MQFDFKGLFDLIEQRLGRPVSTGLLLLVVLALAVVALGLILQGFTSAYRAVEPLVQAAVGTTASEPFLSWGVVLPWLASASASFVGAGLILLAYRTSSLIRPRRPKALTAAVGSGAPVSPTFGGRVEVGTTGFWGGGKRKVLRLWLHNLTGVLVADTYVRLVSCASKTPMPYPRLLPRSGEQLGWADNVERIAHPGHLWPGGTDAVNVADVIQPAPKEGVQPEWGREFLVEVYPKNKSSELSHLPPGEYLLVVEAGSESGTVEPTRFHIRVIFYGEDKLTGELVSGDDIRPPALPKTPA